MKRLFSILLVVGMFSGVAPAHAAVSVTVRPGGWSDVVKVPDGFRFVRATSTEVVTELPDGTLTWRTALPEPILYLRAAADASGTVKAITQGNGTGNALVIAASGVTSLGQSFGQNATAIWWSPSRGFVYFVQTSPTTYSVFDSAGCGPCVVTMPATSQGFRDIQPDGTVRRGDDFMSTVIRGRVFWSIAQRGAVTIGQCDPPGICVDVDGKTSTVFKGNAFEPHLAVDGDTLAIATRSEFGAALVIVTSPYPPADTTTVDPPDDHKDPPDDKKDPPDDKDPPQGPSQIKKVEDIRKKYPTPLGARHWEFLVEVAQATGAKLFRKDGGDRIFVPPLNLSVSQDIIIIAPEWIDILEDGERRAKPAWGANPNAGEPDKWIDVSKVKLPGAPIDPPPPPPDNLQKQLDTANATIARQAELIGKLEQLVLDVRRSLEAEEGNVRAEAEAREKARGERDAARAELEALKARPEPTCEAQVPAALKRLGIKVGCRIVRK
jgi:hypothetical protein